MNQSESSLSYPCLILLIGREFIVGIDHPFLADTECGDGLAFGFVEHRRSVLLGGLGPARERHDPSARQVGDALVERFDQQEREKASETVRLARRAVADFT